MADPLREGVVIKWILQIAHRAINQSDWIHQAFVMHELRAKKTDVPRRGLNIFQLAAKKIISPTDAVSDKPRIRIASDGLKFSNSSQIEALICIDIEHPGVKEGDIAQAPVLMD